MLFSDEYQSLMSSGIIYFLKISDPKKGYAIVADFIAMKKRIQQRNLNEGAADLAREDELQTLFEPMIQSTETSTAFLQNGLKHLNSNLKEKSEDRKVAVNHPSLEDIITSIGMSDTSKLDPYFSIQRMKDGYMMGTKKVTLDDANIYIDDD